MKIRSRPRGRIKARWLWLLVVCVSMAAERGEAQAVVTRGEGVLVLGTGDVGLEINDAFRMQGGTTNRPSTSALVKLSPGGMHVFQTSIVIPNSTAAPYVERPTLDCQGSVLIFEGAGDAITVLEQNGDSPTGAVRNCVLRMAEGNVRAVNAIHQQSRIWFTYESLQISGFTHAGAAAILLENTKTEWHGYTERSVVRDVSLTNNTNGLRLLGSHGGTNSFGRSNFDVRCSPYDHQACLSVEGADVYESNVSVHGNLMSPSGTSKLLSITGPNGILRSSLVSIGGEGDGYSGCLISTDATGAFLDNTGIVANTGGLRMCLGGTSDFVQLPPSSASGWCYQNFPYAAGVTQANNAKLCFDGESLRLGLPVLGGYPSGGLQVYRRRTDGNPEVDAAAEKGAAQENVFYVSPGSGRQNGEAGVGIGPGFGPDAGSGGVETKGASAPAATLDIHGAERVGPGTQGPPGKRFLQRSVAADGTLVDFFQGDAAGRTPPGTEAPRTRHAERFFDPSSGAEVDGTVCSAANGVRCTTPELEAGKLTSGHLPVVTSTGQTGVCGGPPRWVAMMVNGRELHVAVCD